MGYESKLYIADYHKKTDWMDVIGSFDLCKMGSGFRDIFKTPITSEVWLSCKDCGMKDMYGEVIKYADLEDVAAYLETHCRHMKYRRIEPCIAFLRGFNKSEWEDLKVLHYGH